MRRASSFSSGRIDEAKPMSTRRAGRRLPKSVRDERAESLETKSDTRLLYVRKRYLRKRPRSQSSRPPRFFSPRGNSPGFPGTSNSYAVPLFST